MTIRGFIQTQILLPRLREMDVLVVYDPDQRYRDLCLALQTETRPVIDATESSIESREAASSTLQVLGQNNPPIEGMIVYVPAAAPVTR